MTNSTTTFRWKIIKILDNLPPVNDNNIIFRLSSNKRLYSQFGIPMNFAIIPLSLTPTIVFHQAIKNLLKKKLCIDIRERSFPYTIHIAEINTEVSLNIKIRLFPPNILSLTIELSAFSSDLDVVKLIDFQRLDYLRPIRDIIQWTIGICETFNQKNFTPQSFRSKPAIHIDSICLPEEFSSHISDNLPKYIGILIRVYDYQLMDKDLVERMIEKNREHNLKSSQELLLIDKQGILYLTPTKLVSRKQEIPIFQRTHDMYEIGIVFDTFMKNYFSIHSSNEVLADENLHKIQAWLKYEDIKDDSNVVLRV